MASVSGHGRGRVVHVLEHSRGPCAGQRSLDFPLLTKGATGGLWAEECMKFVFENDDTSHCVD